MQTGGHPDVSQKEFREEWKDQSEKTEEGCEKTSDLNYVVQKNKKRALFFFNVPVDALIHIKKRANCRQEERNEKKKKKTKDSFSILD